MYGRINKSIILGRNSLFSRIAKWGKYLQSKKYRNVYSPNNI